jgi:hypothetical protein
VRLLAGFLGCVDALSNLLFVFNLGVLRNAVNHESFCTNLKYTP